MAGASDCKIIGPKLPVVVIDIFLPCIYRVCDSCGKADGTFPTSISLESDEGGDLLLRDCTYAVLA